MKREINDRYSKDIINYTRLLILNYRRYFGRRGVLNSDGLRLLNELVRIVVIHKPELSKIIKEVRKNPTVENFMKFAERVLGNEAYELLYSTINNYYS